MGTGGGEGAAYAGFLFALQRQKIPVGGVCACGASVFPSLLAANVNNPDFSVRVWSQLETSGLVPNEQAVYGAMATLLHEARLESSPMNLAVVACDVKRGQPVVLTTGEAAPVAALSLWSSSGPCMVKVNQRDLSDGSVFGIPVSIAARVFGRPVVAVRADRHARTGATLAETLIQIAAHRLDGRAELTVDIEIQPGQEHDVGAWFSTGERLGRAWGPRLAILGKTRNRRQGT
jgi:predicted acylesterase/phospholipase RssA